jgi:type II secretory pathway component GspD/PulD (secretin)
MTLHPDRLAVQATVVLHRQPRLRKLSAGRQGLRRLRPALAATLFGMTLCAFTIGGVVGAAQASDRLASASTKVRQALSKKVTLTFTGMDCTEALKVLSEQSGVNIAIAAGVTGTISLLIDGVEVGTALDLVTEMTGNAYIAEGEIIRVIPEAAYIKETGTPFRSRHVLQSHALKNMPLKDALLALTQLGLQTEEGKVFPDVDHNCLIVWDVPETQARLAELVELLDRQPTTETAILPLQNAGTDSLLQVLGTHLSEGVGSAELLGCGDRLAVTDLPSKIPGIKQLVADLDVAPKQVLIEAKILQVSHSDETNTGINWQAIQEKLNHFEIESVYPALPRTPSGAITSGTVVTIGNLEDHDFQAVVEALSTFGKTDIVSLPRIAAVSGQEARIHVGSSEPYITVSTRESQGIINYYETVTQIDVGVKLNILPTVHPNGFISLKIQPEVSTVTRFETSASGSKIPVVERSTLETTVYVKNDVFVILGGLMKRDQRQLDTGIPILKSIPILKYFFGSTSIEDVRSELVFMIRPRIIRGDESAESAGEP